ncbi:hypothetical protein SAMN02745704_02849 [Paucidesulfovibrio gracilis DSM 16080]|uniref:Uncharacterized protein n=1 Tax=Paucidesulfovibrio gracilis DSM 16080 TaxID=1121449 RepID=A0A1T4Y6M8_9BACT|nr:hypothetical protein SAMN02745704_02849 [Paucidesulfovibrio gracilis DSM 16080]
MNTKWINSFRTGTHTDSAGHTKTWTHSILERIVSNFARRTEDPPLVFGHPTSSDPAQDSTPARGGSPIILVRAGGQRRQGALHRPKESLEVVPLFRASSARRCNHSRPRLGWDTVRRAAIAPGDDQPIW